MGATSPGAIHLSLGRAEEAGGDVSASAGARTASHTSTEGWKIIQMPSAFRPLSHLLVPPAVFYVELQRHISDRFPIYFVVNGTGLS